MSRRNLGNWLRAYIEYTAETESPDQYHYWTAVSLIAAATRRQVWLNLHYFKIFPNMYIFLVGPSGARKSIATEIGMKIAEKVGIKKFSNKITGAALIKDLSEATEKEVIGNEIQLFSPLMIYASELGVFMGSDAYGSGVIADLTDLYDCPSKWEKKTISRGAETIMAPFTTMLAATTPQTLKDTVPTGAVGQGFTSRVLFIWGAGRRKRVPIPPWGVEYEMLASNLIADLRHISTLKGQFEFSDDGFKIYKSHYMERLEPEDEYEDERLRGYSSRKDIHTLKLAQCISLSHKDDLIITGEDMVSAIEAIKWIDQGLPYVFEGHGHAANAGDVIRVFRQIESATKNIGYASHPDLVRKNYSHLNAAEFATVMQTLGDAGAIDEIVTKDAKTQKIIKVYRAVDGSFLKKMKAGIPSGLHGKE